MNTEHQLRISPVSSSITSPATTATPVATMDTRKVKTPKTKSQGLVTIWHGLPMGNLARLLMMGPPLHWTRTPQIASIAAVSVWNSMAGLYEKLRFGSQIASLKMEHDPVFILGHWRSGTTLLHNLMTMDPNVTFANTYQTLFPGHFLSTESIAADLTARCVPSTRPMDNMPSGWKFPQEDEIALALSTLLSPYLMLAFFSRPDVYGPYLELTDIPEHERRRWKEAFLEFCKKLTIRDNKPIVLKSPTHTFRVPILLEMFPNAKFLYVYREPYAALNSSLHLRRSMYKQNGLGVPSEEGMLDDMVSLYDRCIRVYESTKGLIPAGNLHEVRFEDLEEDPLGQVAMAYEKLSLPNWDQVAPRITAELPALRQYKKNAFQPDPEFQRYIYSRVAYVFERYGYSSQLSDAA